MSDLRILVLTDRAWTFSGVAEDPDPLRDQVRSWAQNGHDVLVLGRRRRGQARREQAGRIEVRRGGGRLTTRLRLALRTLRGAGSDAEVVLEVVDALPLMAPLWWWLDAPQVTLVHHIHGARRSPGTRLAALWRRAAIGLFYGHHAFMAVSERTRDELLAIGVEPARISLATLEPAGRADALEALERAADEERARLRDALRQSQTGAAAGLAAATLANNAIQLVFTIVFTRLLGANGYGALAALVSAFLILMVTGQSVQAAAAKEVTLRAFGDEAALRLTLRRWVVALTLLTLVLTALSIAIRDPLAHLFGVEEHPWAATAVLPAGSLWMLLSLQRGALQGLHSYLPVGYSLIGEAAGRVLFGLLFVGIGGGVTGAFLGSPVAFAVTALCLGVVLSKRLGPLPEKRSPTRRLVTLVVENRLPIFGLLLLALLQNVDVIIARHEFSGDDAGSYAAAGVAAKAVVWVAIGVGLQVLPEATRRAADGDDPRPVLLRALGVLGVVAAPALILFALIPGQLLRIAFGEDLGAAAGALPLLGVAMTLLAIAYLTVQYLIALGEWRFVWVLMVVAAVEPLVLLDGGFSLTQFAGAVMVLQAVVATLIFAIGMTTKERHGPAADAAEVA